jgi:hypothetical protein
MDYLHWIQGLKPPEGIGPPPDQRTRLEAAAIFYGRFLAEDPVTGSEFDHRVLESLTNLLKENVDAELD